VKQLVPVVRPLRGSLRSALVALVVLGSAGQARAYTEPRSYLAPAQEGGGGGRFFTGSPAEGYACSVCHVSAERERVELRGLPEAGYVPGVTYELRLAWPEYARRADQLRERGEGPPSMSLVTELVAESGEGAGVIEISGGRDAEPSELCALPLGQQGTVLFALRPGEEAAESGTRCEANALGQRCVAAVLSCGVRELRLKWTAPKTWQGAIWFSAGFVATDAVSGDPGGDAVTELTRVLMPAASDAARYQSTLRGDCAVTALGPGARRTTAWPGAWLALLVLGLLRGRGVMARARARRRRTNRAWIAALACAALSLFGCRVDEGDQAADFLPVDRADHPLAGLYTPGSTLGYEPVAIAGDASTGGLSAEEQRMIEDDLKRTGGEDRCLPLVGAPGTAGQLHVTFLSDTYGGFYEPANCGAVWIEDAMGHYVATADVWAQMRLRNIFIWQGHRCATDEPDVVSSATLETHEEHDVVWDGLDLTGEIAPDGPYVLNIEVTEDELNFGRRAQYMFDKGEAPVKLEPADQESVRDLVIIWTPGQEAAP
jgi:hypothetical protein